MGAFLQDFGRGFNMLFIQFWRFSGRILEVFLGRICLGRIFLARIFLGGIFFL